MTIEQALRDHLLADTNISSVVATRVYPLELPQNPAFPSITYQIISDEPTYTQDGDSGLDRPRIQIDTWAETYSESISLAALIRSRLSGFRGTVSGKEIQGIFRDSSRDFREVLADGVTKIYRRSQDYFVWHVEQL